MTRALAPLPLLALSLLVPTTPVDLTADIEWLEILRPDLDPSLPAGSKRTGVLSIGSTDVRCYQLSDGRRIFDAEDAGELMEKFR